MAWDFAAEIHSLTAYDADDTSTTGTSGEVLSAHIDQWLVDGSREVINQLPTHLYPLCSTKTSRTDSTAFSFNTNTIGKLLYCTRNNGSYDLPCRLVSADNAGLLADSTAATFYATADDPAYYVTENQAVIFPTPDGDGAAFHHLAYPTTSSLTYAHSSITDFPDEAEYLVVLYAAQKALQYNMTTMTASFNSDVTTALTAVNTAADDIKAEILLANAEVDLEDMDKATGYIATAQSYIAEANAYIAEANIRLQTDVTKYGWYNDQWSRLNAQYVAGLTSLKGAG